MKVAKEKKQQEKEYNRSKRTASSSTNNDDNNVDSNDKLEIDLSVLVPSCICNHNNNGRWWEFHGMKRKQHPVEKYGFECNDLFDGLQQHSLELSI